MGVARGKVFQDSRTWFAIVCVLLRRTLNSLFGSRPLERRAARVVCLGLDGAGKTSFCSCLEGRPVLAEEPTPGFNCRNAPLGDAWMLELWDLGGAAAIRPYWRRYVTEDTALVVFVVDAADASRVGEAREALGAIASAAGPGRPFLVVANKQDEALAADSTELAEALDLEARLAGSSWAVLPFSCAHEVGAASRREDGAGESAGAAPPEKSPELATICGWLEGALGNR